MSLFPTKKITAFEIEPDKVATDNVMSQRLQSIRDEISELSKAMSQLSDQLKWQNTGEAIQQEQPEVYSEQVNTGDLKRFKAISEAFGGGNIVVSTTETMVRLLEATGDNISKSTIKNMLRRMRNTPEFSVESIQKSGLECIYRIEMKGGFVDNA